MGLGELKLDYANVWKEKGTPFWHSGFFKYLYGTCTLYFWICGFAQP